MIRYLAVFVLVFLSSCEPENNETPQPPTTPVANTAPTVPSKVSPVNQSLCLSSPLNFSWNASTDVENNPVSYQIEVAEDEQFSNIVNTTTTSNTQVNFSLDKGTMYFWRVKALDNTNAASQFSSIWSLYTEGEGVANHIPFPPELLGPAINEAITSATVILKWKGADIDGDELSYDLYFGNNEQPALLKENISEGQAEVSLSANGTYYWKIIVKDSKGATATGQLWTLRKS